MIDPPDVFVFELHVDQLVQQATLQASYRPLPKFPAVLRDLAVVVDAAKAAEDVQKVILEEGGKLLESAALFDVYTGKPVPEGRKNLAYALSYRAGDRTLTDAEVNEAHERIVKQVHDRLGGSLRS